MSHPSARANICSFMSFMLQKKKSEEMLAKNLKVSHPTPILGGTKKNGQLAKKVKSLGKSPRECPLVEGIDNGTNHYYQ